MTGQRRSISRIVRAGIAGLGLLGLGMPATAGAAAGDDAGLREEAQAALKKAATFFRTKVAAHGGYAYYYSLDLKERWGEGEGTKDQIWTEPPGTPTVGRAFLEAYDATGDRDYLDAAKEAGMALVYGQLQSGGWRQTIDFNPRGDLVGLYRNGRGSGPNHSSLDDNQTQSCIQFLARLDQALEFHDEAIHGAVLYAMDNLLAAQFPNGGFPQGWSEPVGKHPVLKAGYPEQWPKIWPHEPYHTYYTLNDGLAGSMSDTLIAVFEVYQDRRYLEALARLGDFLLLAQMPDPQPAWCQQYNFDMHPTWARKFEPPAISGLESEDAIRTLMKIYRVTGDGKYLATLPKALVYLRKSRLPDGRMARFYELKTNRPLYMNRPPGVSGNSSKPGYYYFTYDDKNLPSHYGWKQKTEVEELIRELKEIVSGAKKRVSESQTVTPEGKLIAVAREDGVGGVTADLVQEVRRIIAGLDDKGRWITVHDGSKLVGQPDFRKGFRYIGCNVFNRHVEVLSQYLAATAK